VITGYNTDIEFGGVVYHVQTEDKGLSKPIILSLVYQGGTILASKRSPYDDLIADDLDETVLSERLNRQHRLICAAVKAGRIEDLKQMSAPGAIPMPAAAMPVPAAAVSAGNSMNGKSLRTRPEIVIPENALPEVSEPVFPDISDISAEPQILDLSAPATSDTPIPIPDMLPTVEPPPDNDLLDTKTSFLDEEIVVPAEAVEIISDLAETERPVSKKLSVEFVGPSDFKGGERKTVTVMVCRGSERKVVADAQTMVKIPGTSFRPLIFHAKTDANGIAKINLQIPTFQSGRAALLIRVINGGEEIELRRAVRHG
jgi:hypothetical protein